MSKFIVSLALFALFAVAYSQIGLGGIGGGLGGYGGGLGGVGVGGLHHGGWGWGKAHSYVARHQVHAGWHGGLHGVHHGGHLGLHHGHGLHHGGHLGVGGIIG